jgi:hypothetical protein
MLNFDKLRWLDPSRIEKGNLVLVWGATGSRWGIVAEWPHNKQLVGVLALPEPTANGNAANLSMTVSHQRVLDTGLRPEFHWDAETAPLVDQYAHSPQCAHISVGEEGAVINGRTHIAGRDHWHFWDISSGAEATNRRAIQEINFPRWTIGYRDADSEFHELRRFPPE